MSLILDALRKLEREKDAREPGVLVVGSVPWGERSRTRPFWLAAGAAAVLGFAVFVGWTLRPSVPAPAPVVAPSAATPTPTSRPAPPAPAALPPAAGPTTASAFTPPAAPPIRISRPPSTSVPRAASTAAANAAQPPPAPEPQAAAAPPAQPTEQISVGPAAAEPTPAVPSRQAPAADPDELRLSAISRRDGRPVALINDHLVFEGDSFEGVRVLRIGEAEVEVEVNGQRRVLKF